jgi:hypothetical protein
MAASVSEATLPASAYCSRDSVVTADTAEMRTMPMDAFRTMSGEHTSTKQDISSKSVSLTRQSDEGKRAQQHQRELPVEVERHSEGHRELRRVLDDVANLPAQAILHLQNRDAQCKVTVNTALPRDTPSSTRVTLLVSSDTRVARAPLPCASNQPTSCAKMDPTYASR